jgi:hypothetical protein
MFVGRVAVAPLCKWTASPRQNFFCTGKVAEISSLARDFCGFALFARNTAVVDNRARLYEIFWRLLTKVCQSPTFHPIS